MTRLKKELCAKGILFEADEFDVMRGAEYDQGRYLVAITDKYIITKFDCAVVPSELHIFDRHTFAQVAIQNLLPDYTMGFYNDNRWGSYVFGSKEQKERRI